MTQKTYRTAQGRIIDLGALQLQNEHVRAVGNMGVNARGDIVDSNNKPISSRNTQIGRQYQRQVSNVANTPVSASKNRLPKISQPIEDMTSIAPPEDFDDNFDKTTLTKPKS
jgi:hypothetical protein